MTARSELSLVMPAYNDARAVKNNEHQGKCNPELSIIVPAHNESKTLKQNVMLIDEVARQMTDRYELIISEDGSTDETNEIAKELAGKDSRIRYLHADQRFGKGSALKEALKVSRGRIGIFMDADLATSLEHLPQVVKAIKEGYTMAFGSRYVRGSHVQRTFSRSMASRAYNLFVRLLFRTGVRDHQIGFKAFDTQRLRLMLDDIEDNGFFFDTELIIKARRSGFKMAEIPVKWCEPDGRIPVFSLFKDGLKMGIELLKLRIRMMH